METQIAFKLLLSVGGFCVILFLMRRLFRVMRAGQLERKAALPPFTRVENPTIFWSFLGYIFIAIVIMVFGTVFAVVDFIDLLL